MAGVIGDDFLSAGLEVAGSAVVAEALPAAQNLLGFGGGEGLDCWEMVEEAFEVGDDGEYLSLLEHRFADQDMVGMGAAGFDAPGEIAAVTGIPAKKRTA